jgi:hypothetical protein
MSCYISLSARPVRISLPLVLKGLGNHAGVDIHTLMTKKAVAMKLLAIPCILTDRYALTALDDGRCLAIAL